MEIKKLIKKSKGVVQNADVAIPHSFHTITTDTRILEKNDIFVALKGANADGNKYIEEAIEKGASMIFTDQELDSKSVPIIKVEDAYKCLYDFASCYLEETSTSVIAITGSVGKTTTKELISNILSKKYKVLKSEGNKNNRIGIPQTIFKLTEDIDYLVLELGMNHLHEIDVLSNLVKPDIGVITNIGSAHIGNLGSKKNILNAKMEIISGMNEGILVLNGYDKLLDKVEDLAGIKIDKVYIDKGNMKLEIIEQTIFGTKIHIINEEEDATVFFKIPGEAMIYNIALALHIGKLLEVPFLKMIEVLEEYEPLNQRLSLQTLSNGDILINDSYNSSYESLMMDLELLKKEKEHKVIILGDILELGKSSKKIHKKVGEEVQKIPNSEIHFIGKDMKYAWEKCKDGMYFENNQEWITYWQKKKDIKKNSIILLKGSRRMKLEELIPFIEKAN
ncbi:MAG: UDP-N-acetylmuramoyl-tripeptide--D-alanyl-D-alanine ligase [Bacilli bacterium]|nr:UDP-N-acetylmuramoyl-tripeptide--D-alanyl-D-alanine ligase [Bacilli bacterium]